MIGAKGRNRKTLIVGIVNGKDKGVTSREISLVNDFGFGLLTKQEGVGQIGDRYGTKMTKYAFMRSMQVSKLAQREYEKEEK